MNLEVRALQERAEKARILYNLNKITRGEAKNEIMPYIDACNKKSEELAKKYNQRPRPITFASFVR